LWNSFEIVVESESTALRTSFDGGAPTMRLLGEFPWEYPKKTLEKRGRSDRLLLFCSGVFV
jgi:hypothetical protein